jgi:hypothetical protein
MGGDSADGRGDDPKAARTDPETRKGSLLLSGLLMTPDNALKVFRDRRAANPNLDVDQLRRARDILDALYQAINSNDPAPWKRIDEAWKIILGKEGEAQRGDAEVLAAPPSSDAGAEPTASPKETRKASAEPDVKLPPKPARADAPPPPIDPDAAPPILPEETPKASPWLRGIPQGGILDMPNVAPPPVAPMPEPLPPIPPVPEAPPAASPPPVVAPAAEASPAQAADDDDQVEDDLTADGDPFAGTFTLPGDAPYVAALPFRAGHAFVPPPAEAPGTTADPLNATTAELDTRHARAPATPFDKPPLEIPAHLLESAGEPSPAEAVERAVAPPKKAERELRKTRPSPLLPDAKPAVPRPSPRPATTAPMARHADAHDATPPAAPARPFGSDPKVPARPFGSAPKGPARPFGSDPKVPEPPPSPTALHTEPLEASNTNVPPPPPSPTAMLDPSSDPGFARRLEGSPEVPAVAPVPPWVGGPASARFAPPRAPLSSSHPVSSSRPAPSRPPPSEAAPRPPASQPGGAPSPRDSQPLPAHLESLAVEHYAAMCAECAVHPEWSAPILARYGIRNDAERALLEEHWQRKMSSSPSLEATFRWHFSQYEQWARQRR